MMRRVLFVLLPGLVVVSFSFVPMVFAAKFKVPKAACYTLSSDPGPLPFDNQTLALAFKSSGLKIKTDAGNTKLYSIQGAMTNAGFWNLTGSGYVVTDGDQFHGDFSCKAEFTVLHCSYFLYGEGANLCCQSSANNFAEEPCYTLNEIECQSIPGLN